MVVGLLLRATVAAAAAALGAWLAPLSAALAQTAEMPAPVGIDPDEQVRDASSAGSPAVVMTVRSGISVSPSYFGSDDSRLAPDAGILFAFKRLPGSFSWGSADAGPAGMRSGWSLRGSARYVGGRDDTGRLSGLGDVDPGFETGFGLGYEQRAYRVFTDVRYGIVGTNAWTGEVGADGIAHPATGLTLSLGPRLAFGDDRFTETYFGISDAQSTASGMKAHQAPGGLYSAGIEVGARYMVGSRWGVEGAASWNRLVGGAGESPVTEAGSPDQYKVRLGLTRSISLDF